MPKISNWLNEVLSLTGIALSADVMATKEILGIILAVLNIIILVLSFGLKVWNWFESSLDDKKIDKEEIEELGNIIEDFSNEINKEDHDE